MSKNLESEYKNLMNDQIPDLWDRIEAGLGEQEPALTADAQEPAGEPTAPVPRPSAVTGKRAVKRWRWIAGIAAAAACVCIIVPAALSVGNRSSMSSDAMTAEALPEELNFKEAAAFEESEAYAEAALEEAAYDEAAFEEESAAEAIYDSDMALTAPEAAIEFEEESYSIGDSPKAAMESDELYEEAEAEEAAGAAYEKTAAAGETAPADIITLNNVEFKITSISEEDRAAGKVTAQIISCPDDPALVGSTVSIKAHDETVTLPEEPGTYIGNLSINESDREIYLLS